MEESNTKQQDLFEMAYNYGHLPSTSTHHHPLPAQAVVISTIRQLWLRQSGPTTAYFPLLFDSFMIASIQRQSLELKR